MLVVGGGCKCKCVCSAQFLDHTHISLRPHSFCVLDAVGQEFVGCSSEKTNGIQCKSSRVCFTATYYFMKFHMITCAKSIFITT